MRGFELLQVACRRSGVYKQRRTSAIYCGAEDGDLREADQSGVTISEVCRRHGLAASVFYRCRAVPCRAVVRGGSGDMQDNRVELGTAAYPPLAYNGPSVSCAAV